MLKISPAKTLFRQGRGGDVSRDVIEGVMGAAVMHIGGDLAGLVVGGCDFSPTFREGAVRALRPRCGGVQGRGGDVSRDVIEGVGAALACVGGDLAGLKVGDAIFHAP